MLEACHTIDIHLMNCRNANFTDNVRNILNSLFTQEEEDSIWKAIKSINFIQPELYKLSKDMFNNVAFGFGNRKTKLLIRKESLRKSLADYLIE